MRSLQRSRHAVRRVFPGGICATTADRPDLAAVGDRPNAAWRNGGLGSIWQTLSAESLPALATGSPLSSDFHQTVSGESVPRRRVRPGMFVARVVGKSMGPTIPDGAYCLFASPVEGTRQGSTVLVQLRDTLNPETGQRYTVKRYESEKTLSDDSWQHTTITLKPVNPEFAPIVLTNADDGQLQVIAEVLEVFSDS